MYRPCRAFVFASGATKSGAETGIAFAGAL